MTLEDAILEKVRQLPTAQQEQVLQFADSLQAKSQIKQVPYRDRTPEMRWLAENRHKDAYVDQWVALDGDSLVAVDPDGLKVYQAAKAKGIEVPFVVHLGPKDPLPFGGW